MGSLLMTAKTRLQVRLACGIGASERRRHGCGDINRVVT